MRRESAVSNRRASALVATIGAAALLVLGVIGGGAFGQSGEVVAGDDIKYRSVCQNLIGELGVFLDQADNAAAAAQYGDVTAEDAQEQDVSAVQVNECLNDASFYHRRAREPPFLVHYPGW